MLSDDFRKQPYKLQKMTEFSSENDPNTNNNHTKYTICNFCEEPHSYGIGTRGGEEGDDPISNYNGLFICYHCEYNILPIQYNIQENGECCVCFEESSLVTLPSCVHKICLGCCKTIYFGSSTESRPPHWREITNNPPPWPFAADGDEEITRQLEEYIDYENEHFIYQEQSYEELVLTRDWSIPYRSAWMNTDIFIEYENQCFRYHHEFEKIVAVWNTYRENKTRGNGKCPLCRVLPNI